MLTIDSLRDFGANVDEGLGRCINNEQLYFRLVKKAADTSNVDELKKAVSDGDTDRAFEICHSMKGVMGNLSLTPIFDPASELTELLRAKQPADYNSYVARIEEGVNRLKAICG